jgi:hypothetical protein
MNLFSEFTQGHHKLNSYQWYYFLFNILFISQLELHPKNSHAFKVDLKSRCFGVPQLYKPIQLLTKSTKSKI